MINWERPVILREPSKSDPDGKLFGYASIITLAYLDEWVNYQRSSMARAGHLLRDNPDIAIRAQWCTVEPHWLRADENPDIPGLEAGMELALGDEIDSCVIVGLSYEELRTMFDILGHDATIEALEVAEIQVRNQQGV